MTKSFSINDEKCLKVYDGDTVTVSINLEINNIICKLDVIIIFAEIKTTKSKLEKTHVLS